jgi:hypothetical protein
LNSKEELLKVSHQENITNDTLGTNNIVASNLNRNNYSQNPNESKGFIPNTLNQEFVGSDLNTNKINTYTQGNQGSIIKPSPHIEDPYRHNEKQNSQSNSFNEHSTSVNRDFKMNQMDIMTKSQNLPVSVPMNTFVNYPSMNDNDDIFNNKPVFNSSTINNKMDISYEKDKRINDVVIEPGKADVKFDGGFDAKPFGFTNPKPNTQFSEFNETAFGNPSNRPVDPSTFGEFKFDTKVQFPNQQPQVQGDHNKKPKDNDFDNWDDF